MATGKRKKARAASKVSSAAAKTKNKSTRGENTTSTTGATDTTPTTTVSSPPGKASTSQSSNQSLGRPVSLVRVPATARTNDDDGHGDLTVEEGVPGDRSASLAFQSLLATANSNLDLRMTIRNYVTQHFFKHVKFITRSQKLAYFDPSRYPNTYCAVVTKGCNLPPGTDAVQWWETLARREEVRRKVRQLRSDRISALKWAYYGKCLRVCV
jgi:hypothetical protein